MRLDAPQYLILNKSLINNSYGSILPCQPAQRPDILTDQRTLNIPSASVQVLLI